MEENQEQTVTKNGTLLKKVSNVVESKLFLLLLAALLASQLCPRWLISSATISTERQWQLTTREKALNAVDDAALSCLLPLQSPNYDSATVQEMSKYRQTSSIAMNKAMVLIRLLYGTEIMEQFREEVANPLAQLFIEGLKAKSNKNALTEFQKHQQKSLMDMAKRIDDWEKKIAGLPMVSHY
jgi:hypothetical protein